MISWPSIQHAFTRDGSLRDIYVLETSVADWQYLIDLLRLRHRLHFIVDTENAELPPLVTSAFALRSEHAVSLHVDVGGIDAVCHFFTETEIEFDIVPTDICDASALRHLIAFIEELGRLFNKPVLVTPENQRESAFLRFDPTVNAVISVRQEDV